VIDEIEKIEEIDVIEKIEEIDVIDVIEEIDVIDVIDEVSIDRPASLDRRNRNVDGKNVMRCRQACIRSRLK
jgi:hypothetical protein